MNEENSDALASATFEIEEPTSIFTLFAAIERMLFDLQQPAARDAIGEIEGDETLASVTVN